MTTQIEELVNRLRKPYEDILRSKWPINPDGPDAAVKLEAQAARIKELEAQLKLERQNSKDVINAAEEHISTLEAQLKAFCEAATAVKKDVGTKDKYPNETRPIVISEKAFDALMSALQMTEPKDGME